MPKKTKNNQKEIEQYKHTDKDRVNIPPVGLVTPKTDPEKGEKKKYAYDPHLDPQLVWAGKAEHTSFEVPTVSLHVHERIDPQTIIETVRKEKPEDNQPSLFTEPKPLREAIDFYKHKEGWSNRLIAGDSLLVMNSLLEKEGMAGKVQMVYFDPPYGIKYGSNFQPFINKRDVKDGKDDDLSAEPEMIKAFRDTWELGIHSYLTYLRDRLLLARELLSESGSIFVQISDENVHHVREIMDEVFGADNFIVLISYRRLGIMIGSEIKSSSHYIVWYSNDRAKYKFHKIFEEQIVGLGTGDHFTQLENIHTKELRAMTKDERRNPNLIPNDWRPYQLVSLQTHGVGSNNKFEIEIEGKVFYPGHNKAWRTTWSGIQHLIRNDRLQIAGKTLRFKQYIDDFPLTEVGSIWTNAGRDQYNYFIVQTPSNIITRCLLMTTDPGDLVLDITCGSGTTAHVAEQWGRRWITCDTSLVAVTLAKQRLMTASFDYYVLADEVRNGQKVPPNGNYTPLPLKTENSQLKTKNYSQVEVLGFDYYNPKTGDVESGGKGNIAMWLLDTDYDNRSLFPRQVFFPMAGQGDGWDKLAKNLKAEIDEEKIEAFRGTMSLEFEPGDSIAVKIIDDRGIESLRVMKV